MDLKKKKREADSVFISRSRVEWENFAVNALRFFRCQIKDSSCSLHFNPGVSDGFPRLRHDRGGERIRVGAQCRGGIP